MSTDQIVLSAVLEELQRKGETEHIRRLQLHESRSSHSNDNANADMSLQTTTAINSLPSHRLYGLPSRPSASPRWNGVSSSTSAAASPSPSASISASASAASSARRPFIPPRRVDNSSGGSDTRNTAGRQFRQRSDGCMMNKENRRLASSSSSPPCAPGKGWLAVVQNINNNRDSASSSYRTAVTSQLDDEAMHYMNQLNKTDAHYSRRPLLTTRASQSNSQLATSASLPMSATPTTAAAPSRLPQPFDDHSPDLNRMQSPTIAGASVHASPMHTAFPSLMQSPIVAAHPSSTATIAVVPATKLPLPLNDNCTTESAEFQQQPDEPRSERSYDEVMSLWAEAAGTDIAPSVHQDVQLHVQEEVAERVHVVELDQEMKSSGDPPNIDPVDPVNLAMHQPAEPLPLPTQQPQLSSRQTAGVLSQRNVQFNGSSSIRVVTAPNPSPWNPPMLSPSVTSSVSVRASSAHAVSSESISQLQKSSHHYFADVLGLREESLNNIENNWFARGTRYMTTTTNESQQHQQQRQEASQQPLQSQNQNRSRQPKQAHKSLRSSRSPASSILNEERESRESFSRLNAQVASIQTTGADSSDNNRYPSQSLAPLQQAEAKHRQALQQLQQQQQQQQSKAAAVIHQYPVTKLELHADDYEEEDMPICKLRSITSLSSPATMNSTQQANNTASKQVQSFRPPRAVATTSTAVARTPLAAPPNATAAFSSSSSASSIECPLRFYPPSFVQQSGKALPSYHAIVKPNTVTLRQPDGSSVKSDSVFLSPYEYSNLLTQAVCMSMQPLVNKMAKKYALTSAAFRVSGRPVREKQTDMRRAGVSYYDNYTVALTTFNQLQFQRGRQRQEAAQMEKAKRAQLKKQQQKQVRDKRKAQMAGKAYIEPEEEEDDEADRMMDTNEPYDDMQAASSAENHIRYYLHLSDPRMKERASAQGDLWLISTNEEFDISGNASRSKPTPASSSNGNFFPLSNSHSFVLFVCSVWHSFSSQGKLEIRSLPLPSVNNNSKTFHSITSKSQKIYAIRLGDFRSECSMLQVLNDEAQIKSAPLLPYLLHGLHWQQFADNYDQTTGVWLNDKDKMEQQRKRFIRAKQTTLDEPYAPTTAPPSTTSKHTFIPLSNPLSHSFAKLHVPQQTIALVKQDFLERYVLNKEQLGVLENVLGWFHTIDERGRVIEPTSCPIQLVHGCFGAGKSYLLVVVIGVLSQLLEEVDPEGTIKILIASLTNVAVDGILLGLQKLGVDFIRIGSVGRVAPPIVRHMVHVGVGPDGKTTEEQSIKAAQKDLRDRIHQMKSDATNPDGTVPNGTDLRTLELALEELSNQKKQRRSTRLKKSRIVGMTCAACEFELIQTSGIVFPIVFLDEASQMTEPTSLIPIIKFKAERLLAVGG